MSRTGMTVAGRHAEIVARIGTIKAEPPFWSNRRVGAFLRDVEGRTITR